METLGNARSKEAQAKINSIIENNEPFFEVKQITRDLYVISNRVTGKVVSEHSYPRGKAMAILEELL